MTPKQIAIRRVAKTLGLILAYTLGVALVLHFVPIDLLGIVASLGLVAYLIKLLYEFELEKAEVLAKMVDRYKD